MWYTLIPTTHLPEFSVTTTKKCSNQLSIMHVVPLCSSSSLVMLVVLGCFLELSRFRASLSRFLTRLSSLSSRFSHSKSFFLFSNRFSASFRRFISFCSRRVRYLRHKNKNITIYNQRQQKTTKNEQKKNAKRQNIESGAKIKKCIHLFTKANIGTKRYTT